MSSADTGSEERPRREVAHRIFAAEFDDADLSYSESDEERAPNYVVTPTGARANRLFAAGVLTELDELGNGQLRARIVDPTGAFVVYAGQYQPEALAALERLSPPAFVAVTGKARTFQPEDSNRVFTSIRPESVSEIDAATRDRWIVETAGRTLDRVAAFAATLAENGAGGAGGDGETSIGGDATGPQSGISLAREHYGTTPAYLAAMRELALDAARLVAGDAEEVEALGVEPDEAGNVDLAALASSPLGGATVATIVDSDGDRETPASVDREPADAEPNESGVDTAGSTDAATSAETTHPDESSVETETEPETAMPESDDSIASDAEAIGSDEGERASEFTTTVEDDGAGDTYREGGTDDRDDFGGIDGIDGINDPGTSGVADGSEAAGDDSSEAGDEDDDIEGFDGEFDLSDEERAAVEAEYGTDFTTGTEIDDPGEADIEPTAPPVENDGADDSPAEDGSTADSTGIDEPAESESDANDDGVGTGAGTGTKADIAGAATDGPAETADPDVEPEQAADESSDVGSDSDDGGGAGTEESDEPASEGGESGAVEAADEDSGGAESTADIGDAADVDVTEAVMDTMRDLDDGDGADRNVLIDRVSDEYGVPADDVEDAIQDALMGGQCYEPGDGTIKAI